jgi:CBS-domain-containing membrane protein
VARSMAQLQVRRLPVLNRHKRLVGIISLSDLSHRTDASAAGDALRGVSSQSAQHSQ